MLEAASISASVAAALIAVDPWTWSSRLEKALSPVAADSPAEFISVGTVVVNAAKVESLATAVAALPAALAVPNVKAGAASSTS